jgi:flagellar protein FlaI
MISLNNGNGEVDYSYSALDVFHAKEVADIVSEKAENKTLTTADAINDDEFFSMDNGKTTIANRYDLEKEVPDVKKPFFEEVERYWVNKPYAFVVIFRSNKDNENKYFLVEPHLTQIEKETRNFLTEKLRTSIRYADKEVASGVSKEERESVVERKTKELINRFDYFDNGSILQQVKNVLFSEGGHEMTDFAELKARPEPDLLEEDSDTLTEYQIDKLLYYLNRDFIGYKEIDGITNDINVEDISCDGYNQPVFVYHTEYEQLITNIEQGEETLDDFVINLAQRSGKGISKRNPQVDATLPNGSRAQLTLGEEVSDHGTNYTIRQFKEVPFTPIDLINWNTFSLNQMAFLWLSIENHRSLMFAGGTASGKTTSLNAVSLFIPSKSKIVSIEDTREVELPQRNWIASVTRPSFTGDGTGAVDEFHLLEAALRQRPDYIVFGEVRGEEGRSLFQVMSTGHTTYTTFHADNVGEVVKRFTTEPINVSKTLFTSLDLVSVQTQTRVEGHKVRRSKSITEINEYDPEDDEINVKDVYQWEAKNDKYEGFESDRRLDDINTLEEIKFDRGWSDKDLRDELSKRRVVLSYLIVKELNTYTQVASTVQAFINDDETVLSLIAEDKLEKELENLREMENILIDVSEEQEESAPRPDVQKEQFKEASKVLKDNKGLLEKYKTAEQNSLVEALPSAEAEEIVEAEEIEDFEFIEKGE